MLIKDQKVILKAVQYINDSKLQKGYLDRLFKTLEEKPLETPSILYFINNNTYDLTTILNRGKKSKTLIGTL